MKIKNIHFAPFIIFTLAMIYYSSSFGNEYALDDLDMIKHNPYVKTGPEIFANYFKLPPEELLAADTRDGNIIRHFLTRPISVMSFALEIWLFGEDCFTIQHINQVIFFAISSLILYLVLIKLLPDNPLLALLATFIFIIHPIHTEVVANLKSRDELFATLFGLLIPLFFLLKFIENKALNNDNGDSILNHNIKSFNIKGIAFVSIAALSYFIGILSKQNAITFLPVIFLAIYYFKRLSLWKSITPVLFLFIPLIIYLAYIHFTIGISPKDQNTFLQNILIEPQSIADRYATPIFMMLKYLQMLILPNPLVWDYSYQATTFKSFTDIWVISSVIIHLALVYIGLSGIKKRSIISFSILSYFCLIAVNSNLFIVTPSIFGERFLYSPSIAFSISLAWIISFAFKIDRSEVNWKSIINIFKTKPVFIAIIILIFAFSAYQTTIRNLEWKNHETLVIKDIEKNPDAVLIINAAATHYNFKAYFEQNPALKKRYLEKAISFFKRSIDIYPKENYMILSLSRLYLSLKDYKNAEKLLELATEMHPDDRNPIKQLAYARFADKDTVKALEYLKHYVSRPKGRFEQRKNIELVNFLTDFTREIREMKATADINPPKYRPSFNLAVFYFQKLADNSNALKYVLRAIRSDASNPIAFELLASIYQSQGNLNQAANALQQAISISPNPRSTYMKYADLMLESNNIEEAYKFYKIGFNL